MYENNYKNPDETGKSELNQLLQKLADTGKKIELFAIGGTAMVLKNIKEATKDIDFLTTSSYKEIRETFELAGLREKSDSRLCNIWYMEDTRIDIFYQEFILGITLPDDWKKLSEHIKDTGKIKLYILNWYDIIITKIARCEPRDIEDIKKIIQTQKIDFERLKEV